VLGEQTGCPRLLTPISERAVFPSHRRHGHTSRPIGEPKAKDVVKESDLIVASIGRPQRTVLQIFKEDAENSPRKVANVSWIRSAHNGWSMDI